MRLIVSMMFSFLIHSAHAEVGKIVKVVGGNDAYAMRSGQKLEVSVDQYLEQGDELYSADSHLILLLYPSSQISLPKNSHIKITEATIAEGAEGKIKSKSSLELLKGLVRAQVTKHEDQETDLSITSTNVAFAVRGTEFEVELNGEEIDLDVMEGEVEVLSPLVQTFVPEIVKANEGFKFHRGKKQFMRRKFRERLKNHPGFISRSDLKERWQRRGKQRLKQKLKQRRVSRRKGDKND